MGVGGTDPCSMENWLITLLGLVLEVLHHGIQPTTLCSISKKKKSTQRWTAAVPTQVVQESTASTVFLWKFNTD